ncbi:MAG: HNH endonuclease [Planctomycetaceae bacterium]|nr:HNH endonuclease [Planctomycetaceae bacterium]
MKCCNIASLDPSQQARGIKGLQKTSRLDAEIWNEFASTPEQVGYDSELAFSRFTKTSLRVSRSVEWENIQGIDKQVVTKVRVNQHLFRSIILAGYRFQCAVCGLPIQRLLVASHIVPWSADKSVRMNPCNGLCLCALHDRAFDTGVLAITPDYQILIDPDASKFGASQAVERFLVAYSGKRIALPDRWLPDPQLLVRHMQIFDELIPGCP